MLTTINIFFGLQHPNVLSFFPFNDLNCFVYIYINAHISTPLVIASLPVLFSQICSIPHDKLNESKIARLDFEYPGYSAFTDSYTFIIIAKLTFRCLLTMYCMISKCL